MRDSRSRLSSFGHTPPPLFRQGSSAFSRFVFFIALALFFMVLDTRYAATQQIRSVIFTALYPVQWLGILPLHGLKQVSIYVQDLDTAQSEATQMRARVTQLVARASQVEQLALENNRLRQLLGLRAEVLPSSIAAQVLYDAPDPYTRRVVLDKGSFQNIVVGSPVVDELGVIGQVTRVHPQSSEVTLLTDRNHAIPVLNTRTGARSVAYGDPYILGGILELRFMAANADIQVGDLLTTSGIDDLYPAGLAVAKIIKIERRADSAFAKIYCQPVGKIDSTNHVLVINLPHPNVVGNVNQLADRPSEVKKVGGK